MERMRMIQGTEPVSQNVKRCMDWGILRLFPNLSEELDRKLLLQLGIKYSDNRISAELLFPVGWFGQAIHLQQIF